MDKLLLQCVRPIIILAQRPETPKLPNFAPVIRQNTPHHQLDVILAGWDSGYDGLSMTWS